MTSSRGIAKLYSWHEIGRMLQARQRTGLLPSTQQSSNMSFVSAWTHHRKPAISQSTSSRHNFQTSQNYICATRADAVRCFASATASISRSGLEQVPHSSAPASEREQVNIQQCDFTVLSASTHELAQHWIPAKVDQVIQADPHSICLKLRAAAQSPDPTKQQTRTGWLWLSWHPKLARLCMGAAPARGSAAEGFAFGEQVHAQLSGQILIQAHTARAWDRVVQLQFSARLSNLPSHSIYLEVMGRHSNIILTDAKQETLASGRQVSGAQSRMRPVQAGCRYELPPRTGGLPPSLSEPQQSWQDSICQAAPQFYNNTGLRSGLVFAYQGVGPALAGEVMAAAGIPQNAVPDSLTDDDWHRLHQQWTAWLHAVQMGKYQAGCNPDTGRLSLLGGITGDGTITSGSIHEVLDQHFKLPKETQGSKLRHSVSSALAKAQQRAERKAGNLSKNLAEAEGSVTTRRNADIIMANVYRCKLGDAQLDAEDWETGEPVSIPLDVKAGPIKTAEALFAKARKQRRAVDHIGPLLQAAREDISYLADIEAQLNMLDPSQADDLQALRGIQEELVHSGYAKPAQDAVAAAKGAAKGRKAAKRAAKGTGAAPSSAQGFRQFSSPSGLTVLIGRNNRQNDELSHRIAQPQDVWMHARGVPGAHTVLRIPAGREAGQEDIQFAADLAAYFSKARAEGKTPVTTCQAGDVKRPKGGKPGQALVAREKTHVGRPHKSAAAAMEEQ